MSSINSCFTDITCSHELVEAKISIVLIVAGFKIVKRRTLHNSKPNIYIETTGYKDVRSALFGDAYN